MLIVYIIYHWTHPLYVYSLTCHNFIGTVSESICLLLCIFVGFIPHLLPHNIYSFQFWEYEDRFISTRCFLMQTTY